MPTVTPVACPQCTKEFKPTTHQRRQLAEGRPAYCSKPCFQAARSETRPCAACGTPVTRRRSEFSSAATTCSVKCRGAVRKDRVTANCATCGTEVERVPSAAEGPVYCTRACYHVAERADDVVVKCACGCGSDVRVRGARRNRVAAGEPVYASRECQKRAAKVLVPCSGPGCEATVERYRSQMAKRATGHVFCPTCIASGNTAFKPRRGKLLTCTRCEGTYYRSPSMAKASRFCSDSCRSAAEADARVEKTCDMCGEGFAVIPALAHRRYCGTGCRDLGRITRGIPGAFHNGKPKRWNDDGYVLIWEPEYPGVTYSGWVFEHRLVAEQTLGVKLTSKDEVDHINEIKDDNRPENLRVVDKVTHQAITVANAKRRRDQERDELFTLRAERDLRARGYRPVSEVLDEALGALEALVERGPVTDEDRDRLGALVKLTTIL